MSCQFSPDFSIAPNVTYSIFNSSFSLNTECPESYLRPDPGGALIPWLYALFLLLFHLPACIIRAVRWESAQYLALCLALFNVTVTIQSYVSTRLNPAQVLVWMPLTLLLDIGAMLQMVVLILEMPGYSVSVLLRALKEQIILIGRIIAEGSHRKKGREEGREEGQEERQEGISLNNMNEESAGSASGAQSQVANGRTMEIQPVLPRAITAETAETGRVAANRRWTKVKHALVALFATFFGLTLFVLQMYGLKAAKDGLKKKNLTVKWCSPTFRDFALAVTTGNCQLYRIIDSSSYGIGCIELPAYQQEDWLKGTVAALSISLVCQVVDLLLVKFAGRTKQGRDRKVRGTRLRRPWLSLFIGPLIFVLLIYYGLITANQLPKGVTDVIWIYRKDSTADIGRVCRGSLKSPGLRGMIIGWTDGLFGSWGSLYNGRVISKMIHQEL